MGKATGVDLDPSRRANWDRVVNLCERQLDERALPEAEGNRCGREGEQGQRAVNWGGPIWSGRHGLDCSF